AQGLVLLQRPAGLLPRGEAALRRDLRRGRAGLRAGFRSAEQMPATSLDQVAAVAYTAAGGLGVRLHDGDPEDPDRVPRAGRLLGHQGGAGTARARAAPG